MKNKQLSLLYLDKEIKINRLSETTIHDLGIDYICEHIAKKNEEQLFMEEVLSKLTDNHENAEYRAEVFEDIYVNYEKIQELMKVLEEIDSRKKYGEFSGRFNDSNSAWELLHGLEQLNDYIKSVEALKTVFANSNFKSKGLKNLSEYVDNLYNQNAFLELKNDIKNLKASTDNIKSVTLGVNLNEKYEAHGIGIISFNKKEFTKSNVVGEFCSKIAFHDRLNAELEWKNNFKFHPVEAFRNEFFEKLLTISGVNDPGAINSTLYMDRVANVMIAGIVQKLKSTLKKYVAFPITDISDLIPEVLFYMRFVDYIKKMSEKGFKFCKPSPVSDKGNHFMQSKGIYNFKLVVSDIEKAQNIVTNDIDFTDEHLVYILTGANRGGKTTITQAVGLAFILAQAGIYVCADSFEFSPIDNLFTHFPADEDKTMDLGRLGEECRRFKEMFDASSQNSLLLLNETYSTTSFEEGYYIAKDSVKAILHKGIRTIYNTHMHKLASDIKEINESSEFKGESLVMKTVDGKSSFKLEIAPPEGVSFANTIAQKYGVTYNQLVANN